MSTGTVLSGLDQLVNNEGKSEQLHLCRNKDTDGFTIYEKLSTKKRRKLYIRTPILICSTGLQDNNCIQLELNANFCLQLQNFERWLKSELEDHENIRELDLAQETGGGEEDIYRSLIKTDETEHINVFIDTRSRVFDRDGQKVPEDKRHDYLSGYFRCTLALELSQLTVFADKLQINPHIFQLKVMSFSLLPPGCEIYHDISLFLEVMQQRESEHQSADRLAITSYNDAVEDFDPDVNELMD